MNADSSPTDSRPIRIRGARTHNLRGIDVDIPRNRLVVITGVSGSGKSSLAFDTLYAEGRRRYMESLSVQSRRFLTQMEKPDVDFIDGLSPAIAIEQRSLPPNPRSIVATLTEIYDFARVLYAAAGTPHDPDTGTPLQRLGTGEILQELTSLEEGSRITLLATIDPDSPLRASTDLRSELRRQGLIRIRLDGEIIDLDDTEAVIGEKAEFDLVIDRLVNRPGIESRLADSIETARRWSPHRVIALTQTSKPAPLVERVFPTSFTNPETGYTLPDLQPRHFSFNSAAGACPLCEGTGLAPDKKGNTKSDAEACPECGGARLRPWVRAVTLGESIGQALSIDRFCSLSIADAADWIASIEQNGNLPKHLQPLLVEMANRLRFLLKTGLPYLTLDRPASTLSGGEYQRIRLATQLGSGLTGVLYVLDEPSIGLHPSDNLKLLDSLRHLRDLGNSVVVVEHDLDTLRAADHLVEIGPGPGHLGGRLLFSGSYREMLEGPLPESRTRRWLSGEIGETEAPPNHRLPTSPPSSSEKTKWFHLIGASGHNLRGVDLALPLGRLTAIAGVSGSGKSSLLLGTLLPALAAKLSPKSSSRPLPFQSLSGEKPIKKAIAINQKPAAGGKRSTPASYCGALDPIRILFSKTPAARTRGFTASRFSFNRPGGRCEVCLGLGRIEIDMQFLADASITCESCGGTRYNRETLEITYKGRNIYQILEMTVDEAVRFFGPVADVTRRLGPLVECGLSYLRLGQPLETLSGGEAQRLKLASELARPAHEHTLYLLDEPTTGLHPDDTRVLLDNLIRLRNLGHTVVVIEHNPLILRAADWLIETGPGAGPLGGEIIAAAPPEEVAALDHSPTAPFLKTGHIHVSERKGS